MIELAWAGAALCVLATFCHIASTFLAARRFKSGADSVDVGEDLPPVTLLRPVLGVDPYDPLTLRSGFELDYPNYELIFCCADAKDPVVPLIRKLIDSYPNVRARLLIGQDNSTANPKLNNLIKGWQAARHDWIIMADSNVLMPSNYIERILACWRKDTGLVCAPPIGCLPNGLWAEVECAFLNTYQARWQYAADSIGLGFAQGKSMLWRRADVDRAGGIRALGAEIAEDAAATKVVRSQGRRVRLVDRPFGQPLGRRSAAQVWTRQVRWARLRRATFPLFFVPELFSGSCVPLLAGAFAASVLDISVAGVLSLLGVLWFGSEALLARVAGWKVTLWSPFAWIVRDLMLPVLWTQAWLSNSFRWRGTEMDLADAVPNN